VSTVVVLDASAAVRAVMDAAAQLAPVHWSIDEQPLFPEALQLAADLDHPVYDAVYAVSARRHAATLLTFDRRLHALCAQAGIVCDLLSG
jgi:predicted nucleic acid-binding protein